MQRRIFSREFKIEAVRLVRDHDRGVSVAQAARDLEVHENLLSLARSKRAADVFVAGGVKLFKRALPRVDRLYRMPSHETIESTARLAAGTFSGWRETHSERRQRGGDGFPDQDLFGDRTSGVTAAQCGS